MHDKKKVAIVGSGCSGIAACWALKSTKHEVHLYEAADRLGGHTNTVSWRHGTEEVNVDTGFIVMNTATYPNFISFLKEVGIPTVRTEMTFGVSRDRGLFEWAGTSLSAIFAQKRNLFSLRMWQMIFDVIRFNQFALDILQGEDESEEDPTVLSRHPKEIDKTKRHKSIGEYLDEWNYSEAFRDDYLIPMTAAVWSTRPDKVSLEFPAITLIRFLWNHHLLSTIAVRPSWMTIANGSRQYIDAVMAGWPKQRLHLNTSIESLQTESNGQVLLKRADGNEDIYDHVVLATHGDQALKLIHSTATAEEIEILSGFQTSTNIAVLHSDLSLMPQRPITWSSWNYITTSPSPITTPSVCLTYWMNLLQHIPRSKFGPIFVTLNPLHSPHPSLIQGKWTYHHPIYNTDTIRSQKLLPKIQNTRGISYAGAWTKYGFHEDGFSSGLKVAIEHLGAEIPFEFVDSTFSRGRKPVLGWKDYVVRGFVWTVNLWVSILSFLIGLPLKTERSREGNS